MLPWFFPEPSNCLTAWQLVPHIPLEVKNQSWLGCWHALEITKRPDHGLRKRTWALGTDKETRWHQFFVKNSIRSTDFDLKLGSSAENRTYYTSNPWRKRDGNVLFCSLCWCLVVTSSLWLLLDRLSFVSYGSLWLSCLFFFLCSKQCVF